MLGSSRAHPGLYQLQVARREPLGLLRLGEPGRRLIALTDSWLIEKIN